MKTIWDAAARAELEARLGKVKADSRAQWGKMNAAQMMAHCADAMRAALGEMKVTEKQTFMAWAPMRYLIIYVMPWPQGAPTAPELLHEGAEDFGKSRAALGGAIERMVANQGKGWRRHAVFGQMSEKDWGCLTWRHLDHHLRQFGV